MTRAAVQLTRDEPSLEDATTELERSRARVEQREAEHAAAVSTLEQARAGRVEAPDEPEALAELARAKGAVDVCAEDLDAARGALSKAEARHTAAQRRAAAAERASVQRQREALLARFAPALDRLVEAAVAVDTAVVALEELCAEDAALATRIDEAGVDPTIVRLASQLRLGREFMAPSPKSANLSAFRAAHDAVLQPATLAELAGRFSAAREELVHATRSAQLADWLVVPSTSARWDDASPHSQRVAAAARLLQQIDNLTQPEGISDGKSDPS